MLNEIVQAGLGVASLWTVMSKPEVINKILDTASRGFNVLYEPKRIEKIIKKMDGVGENISITNGDFSLKIEGKENSIIENKEITIDETVIKSLVDKSLKEIINVNEILEKTAQLLEQEEKISEEKVDTDWATRYFNTVKDIGNEEMKIIWAKLLADEISSPGAISLRTLDLLRNLSPSEARLFQKIVSFSASIPGTTFILGSDDFLSNVGLSKNNISLMQELNLLHSEPLYWEFQPTGSGRGINLMQFDDKTAIVIETTDNHKSIPIYKFTNMGIQLSKLVERTSIDTYLEYVKLVIKIKSPNAKIYKMDRIIENGASYYANKIEI